MDYTIDELRLLLRDTNSTVFTDEQLTLFHATYPDSIFRAAALAIRSWALEVSAKGKSIRTDDLSVDLRSRGDDLMKVADSFDEEASTAEQADAADIFMAVRPRDSSCGWARPEGTPMPLPITPHSAPTPGSLDGGTP